MLHKQLFFPFMEKENKKMFLHDLRNFCKKKNVFGLQLVLVHLMSSQP